MGSEEWLRADEDMTHFYAYPAHPARTRSQAQRIVELWVECSDGDNGYRSNWLRTH